MPTAMEECHEPSGNCQGISHCLESGHPEYNPTEAVASIENRLVNKAERESVCVHLCQY